MEKVYLIEWVEHCEYEVYGDLGKAITRVLESYTSWATNLENHEIIRDLEDLSHYNYIEDFVYIMEKEVK